MFRLNNKEGVFTAIIQIVCLYCVLIAESYAADTNDLLTSRQKAMIPIAAFTAAGNMLELEKALNAGLDSGLSINEVKEIFIHSYAYAGFPRALNGINTFIRVMDSRKQSGITDKLGNEATPIPVDFDANAYGHKVRNELVGRDISKRTTGYAPFVPTIDTFLVEHLFADIFYRDVLSHKDRELVTISILAAMSGTEAQLTSHIKLSLRVGYSPTQLLQFSQVLKDTVGQDSGLRAQTILTAITDIVVPNTGLTSVQVDKDESVTLGAADKFTGTAKITSRFASPVGTDYRGAMVEFEAGARTAWHTHPKGQTLIIISGKGLVQTVGGDVQEMLPGNVVTIPANTQHWHGASIDSPMSHIAISAPDNGKTVNWMELVNDNQ